MNRAIIFCTTLLLSSLPSFAIAQCLPANLRTTFINQLLARFNASGLTIDQLEAHANDRLGFGRLPPVGSFELSDAERRTLLAERIADSLAQAASLPVAIDQQLAELEITPPEVGAPRRLYRHAATGMTEAYTEIELIRRQLNETTDLEELAHLRKLRNLAINGLRKTAAARTVAELVLSGSPDAGALLGEFWFNHFNVSSIKAAWSIIDYQKALSRRVCGTFASMLSASARHPAMLIYLDNFRSTADAINENYGREILELHTLGDDRLRFYRQSDVIGVAKALTGWGVGFTEVDASTIRPGFSFYRANHDPIALRLFANATVPVPLTVPAATLINGVPTASAVQRGQLVLDHLASHPATRANICRKLSIRLLGVAPADIVEGCSSDAVWGDGGELGAIYRYLLTRPAMWSDTYLNKYKNPIELVVSAHRRAGILRAAVMDVGFLGGAVASVAKLGINIGDVPPPTGYEDDLTWRSAGSILRFTPILFSTLNTDHLGYRTGGQTLRGAALETFVRSEVQAAGTSADPDAALRALGHRYAHDMLGFPGATPLPVAASLSTFRRADTLRADNQRTMLRSFVETALSNRTFLRK